MCGVPKWWLVFGIAWLMLECKALISRVTYIMLCFQNQIRLKNGQKYFNACVYVCILLCITASVT